ncbi:putative Nudix hydrolase YfcD [Algibacter lectus]|uniref:Putative Nudix hydrolase YfcD n=1 Tax=Algibacter lectus TaxID=221126 RepID=A0A090X119_9FLAO|nr:hypothetical protein [Algibacter lectus]GAL81499.1 putative Nudix hydrolase YfcD [Algibacter lectus]
MDEYIDIVSENGDQTGKVALKSEAHKNGWFHNTIHLWLFTRQGEILLQQRSHKKAIYRYFGMYRLLAILTPANL